MRNSFYLLAFIFLGIVTHAQNGYVRGVIKDAEFNDVMPYASVQVKNSTIGVTSDFEGIYELSLTPGNYTLMFSYIGYQNLEITDVNVSENGVFELNVTLQPESNQLQEVVITSKTAKNSEASIIKVQRQSVQVMNGISAEGLNRTSAGNAANAVKSIPGVSVQGDKYVFVRGLGDRYTKSILNGVDIPGLDPDRNTVQMDIFPSNIIDNIQVIKSATADLDADFTGGVVNIVTKDFPSSKTSVLSISTDYNPEMHLIDNFLSYKGSSTDFLGFDNGMRKIPIKRYENIPAPYDQNAKLTDFTKSFNPELKPTTKASYPDFSINYSIGNQKDISNNKLGYLFSIGYKNYTDYYQTYDKNIYYKSDDRSVYELETGSLKTAQMGKKGVLLNGLVGLNFKTQKSKYSLNFIHIQNGESGASNPHRLEYYSNIVDIYGNYLDYTQRSISNLQLSGKHSNDDASFVTEWIISPTYSSIQDKDIKYTPFEYDANNNQFLITPSAGGTPRRTWRSLNEINTVVKIDFTKKHQLFNNDAKLKFGTKFLFKSRDYSIDEFNFYLYNSTGANFNGNANEMLQDENIWNTSTNTGTYVKGNYEPANTYNAFNTNLALFVSDEFNINDKLKTILGVRAEKFDQFYSGQNNAGTIVYKDKKTIKTFDVFPSANLILKLNDKSNLRASYYMATARPSFKETSIAQIYDPVNNLYYNGNPDLKPSLIQNFDLRWELFNSDDELIAVSGFYKTFKNPIELAIYSSSAPNNITHRNIGNAQVYGSEVEFRQNLNFLSQSLKNFALNINYSYIISQQEMDKSPNGEYESKLANLRTGEVMKDTRTLQGQSPYLLNVGLSYDNNDKGWNANLSYNVQGKTLEIVGLSNIPDVYTMPYNSLNFNISKSLGKNNQSEVKLQVINLLNESKLSVWESYKAKNQIYTYKSENMSFGISYKYKF